MDLRVQSHDAIQVVTRHLDRGELTGRKRPPLLDGAQLVELGHDALLSGSAGRGARACEGLETWAWVVSRLAPLAPLPPESARIRAAPSPCQSPSGSLRSPA